jgi:predicted amidohydrolase
MGRARRIERWTVAAVQMNSTTDVRRNVRAAVRSIRQAAAAGATLIALPENFAYLRPEGSPVEYRQDLDGELVGAMREEARRLGRYLLLGSIPERVPRGRRIHNTSVLIGPGGRLLAAYRKMHLFDIGIPDGVELRESRTVRAGDRPVVVRTPLGRLGLSVCYDLRFPELYRRLALAGAQVLFVPAAFTAFTGPHHWLPLLRARAIENQCWVVAPAQVGRHGAGRESHGETAIIDPWGEVVQRLPRRRGWVMAEVDLGAVKRIRRELPALRHVRRDLL